MALVLGGVDFGHYYRFKASVGLALMAAAVGVPWIILRDDPSVGQSRDQLASLTPTARDIVERRQVAYAFLLLCAPVLAAVLGIAGLIFLIQGIRGWKKVQDVADRKDAADTALQEHALSTLSPAEQREKQLADAQEDLAATTDEVLSGRVATEEARISSPTDPRVAGRPMNARGLRDLRPLSDKAERVRHVERMAASAFESAFRGSHSVESDVLVEVGRSYRSTVDLLLRPKRQTGRAIAVEVYLFSSLSTLNKNGHNRISQLAGFRDVYQRSSGQRVKCVALFVFDFAESLRLGSDPVKLEALRRRLADYGHLYSDIVALATDERTMAEIPPADLRHVVEQGRSGLLDPFGGQLVLPLDWDDVIHASN